jgi:hypothetical protein
MHQVYALRTEKVSVTVVPVLNQYRLKILTDREFNWLEMDLNTMLQQLTSGPHAELGQKTIDGIEVDGIEIKGGAKTTDMLNAMGFPIRVDIVSIRLWTDTETSLPVEVAFRAAIRDKYVTVWTDGKPVEIEVVDCGFQWYAELDRSVFEPNITDDYTLVAEASDSCDETNAVAGLRAFALLTGGAYPSKLNMMTILREACQAIPLFSGGESDDELDKKGEQLRQMLISSKPTGLFFSRLVQEGKDVAYYGDTVTAADANSVLLRWRTGEGDYAVVFGDLTTEAVPAEQLAEFERLSYEASR